MYKKWLKRVSLGIAILVGGLVLLDVGLYAVSSSQWVTQKIADKLAQAIGREVHLSRAVVSLRGARIEEFVIAKPGGLAEGELFRLDRARVKLLLWHLFHGQIRLKAVGVEGLSLHVVRDGQGNLNTEFSSSNTAQTDTSSSGAPLDIAVEELTAQNLEITYTDQQTNLQTRLTDARITVRNFSWDKPFEVSAETKLAYQQAGEPFEARLSLKAQTFLAGLDNTKAYADITSLALRAGDSRANLSGRVANFTQPDFDFKLEGQKISSADWAAFVPADFGFDLPRLSVAMRGTLWPEQEKIEVAQAALSLPGLEMSANGSAAWKQENYNLSARLETQLEEVAQAFTATAPYAPAGALGATVELTPKQFTARAEWTQGALRVVQAGEIRELQAALDVTEKTDWKHGQGAVSLIGKLNGEDFKADFSFTQTPAEILANLKAAADKLILPSVSSTAQPNADTSTAAPETISQAEEKSTWNLPPITAKADVQIGTLDAPYLNGKNFKFTLDMSGITPKLDGAYGLLNLAVENGKITDVYQLTNSNALMKVMFMSLNVVGKVFNSLDVLSVLGGLAGSFKADKEEEIIKMIPNENGEMVAVKVPAHTRRVDGQLAYDQFVTDVQFEHGVATVKEGSFVSDMMSFNVSGTTDFATEKLDMTVHAAPGKHQTDGIMPLTLKIGGTVSDPQGSMSVVGSVTSLVTQGVTNNFASRAVKKSISSVWSLFKKKEAPSDTES